MPKNERCYVILKTPIQKIDGSIIPMGEPVIENIHLWRKSEAEAIVNTLNLMVGDRFLFEYRKLSPANVH